MAKPIRIGVIGTGGMANYHAGQFKTVKGCVLTACFDLNEKRSAEYAAKHDIKLVAKSQEQLLDAVDAVTIVTPDRYHSSPTLAAFAAGKHVLCEKPLTVTLEEARKVAKAATAASKRGLIHMINFSYRNSCAFQEGIKVVQKGLLGEIRHVHSSYLQSWLVGQTWGGWQSEGLLWRLQTAKGSGGVLGDLGCHILDFTTALVGELESVRCKFATFAKSTPDGKKVTKWDGVPLDANDTALIELQFANGAVGQTHTTRWATGHGNTVAATVHGTEGALRINLDEGYDKLNLCMGKGLGKHEWETKLIKPTPSNYQRFVTSIKTGKNDQPDILRGAQIQAYLDACERAAQTGKSEKIKSWR